MMENNDKNLNKPGDMAGAHRGMQGIDKAPGKEEREGEIEKIREMTQQGKGKVDGDPTKESDQPIDIEKE